MQVRAIKLGYYNHARIKEGEVFILKERKGVDRDGNKITMSPEQQFSSKWMECVDAEPDFDGPVPVSKSPAKTKAKAQSRVVATDSDVI
jgi:hypothetical protein